MGCVGAWCGTPYGLRSGFTSARNRRFIEWSQAGLWRRLHQAVLDELGARGQLDGSRAVLDAASVRAKMHADKLRRTVGFLYTVDGRHA